MSISLVISRDLQPIPACLTSQFEAQMDCHSDYIRGAKLNVSNPLLIESILKVDFIIQQLFDHI